SVTHVMELITFILVVIGIGDTLAASVNARTRELGMMRAVGLRRWRVVEMVLLEGAGIAFLGLLLSGFLGFALGVFWVDVQFPAILGWDLELHPPLVSMFLMASVTLLLCLAGSFFPALRASRLAVPAALRDELQIMTGQALKVSLDKPSRLDVCPHDLVQSSSHRL